MSINEVNLERRPRDPKRDELIDVCEFLGRLEHRGSAVCALVKIATDSPGFRRAWRLMKTGDPKAKKSK